MDFKDRLQQIDLAEKQAAPPAPPVDDSEDLSASSGVEHATQVRCTECGHNTLREEHSAIMCTICCHGPFCNYCWELHIGKFHPQLAESYSDARRGIRPRARMRNHYLIRTVLKPAGYLLALLAISSAFYFGFQDRGSPPVSMSTSATMPVSATTKAEPQAARHADTAVPLAAVQAAEPDPAARAGKQPGGGEAAALAPTPPDEETKAAPAPPAGTLQMPAPKAPLALDIVTVTSPIQRRSSATLRIRTRPAAFCTIAVIYSSGPSHSKSLGPQVAGADGEVAWTWNIGIKTTPGAWPIEVHCTLKDQKSTARTTITVE